MKILSLWQPWASFIALGYKKNETRSWHTQYRGALAIHAAKNRSALLDADSILKAAQLGEEEREEVTLSGWPLGAILCVVELVDCVPTESIRHKLTKKERAMGDYSDNRFAWITRKCRRLNPMIPHRGTQGLKPVPSKTLNDIQVNLLNFS